MIHRITQHISLLVAVQRSEKEWTIELSVPVTGDLAETIAPVSGVAGRKPNENHPCYFNLCRQRPRDDGNELTAYVYGPTLVP